MAAESGRLYKVTTRGFLYWEGIVIIVAVGSAISLLLFYLRDGASWISGWIWIWVALTAGWSSLAVFGKSTYPGSILVFSDRIEPRSIFGRKRIRIDQIDAPTAVEGSYVWFGTSRDAPGYWGTVLRVNGPVARIILASPHRQPWVVPPDLAQRIATLDL